MVDLKPGWCILHGEREPCRKCNQPIPHRARRAAVLLAALALTLPACKADPHAPAGRIGDGLSATTATVTPAPVPEPPPVTYRSCQAAKAAGATPIHKGDPGYSTSLDRDGDGVACDE